MKTDPREARAEKEMRGSIFAAFLLHIGGFFLVFLWMTFAEAHLRKTPEVFTVTLEGGEVPGGVSQVPVPGKEEEKPPLDAVPEEVPDAPPARSVQEEKKGLKEDQARKKEQADSEKQKELERLTLVEELEKRKKEAELKKEEERRKKELEEKKKKEAEEKKRKAEDAKRKAEQEKKRKAEEEIARKKREERQREQAKKDRDKRLSELAREIRSKKEYQGESVRAGGEGFGGARIGGGGGGGGTLAPYAKVAYQNELQAHVKSGWRWMQRSSHLRTLVEAKLRPDGEITSVRILQSSGNSNFDDSVVRAVKKASPVPPPPREFYSDFATVGFWFDSKDQ
jgi:colicin import membrane protein